MYRPLTKQEGVEAVSKLWRERQCVVFFGAGVSHGSGLPIGEELERMLTRPLDTDNATLVKLRSIFLDHHLVPNAQHQILALLLARYYITTNWDRLLERAFEQLLGSTCSDHFGVVDEDGDISKVHRMSHTCIHLHGDLENEGTIVWADADYARTIRSPRLVNELVAILLAMHPALFVGYSLRDLDVIARLSEQSHWKVGVPPERFAILPENDQDGIRRCEQLWIHSICLDATGDQFGAEVVDFLTQLWERIEGYRVYTRPLDDPPEDTLQSRYERFWAFYRSANFAEAKDLSNQILQQGIDWQQDIPLFARFAYLTVKSYDKLEDWKEVASLDERTLRPQFSRISCVLPPRTFRVISAQYEAGLAMPLLRSWQLEGALKHIDASLDREPPQSNDRDLQCLYADRLTIRAVVRLALWVQGDPETHLNDAWQDLCAAEPVFREYGGMGGKEEVHYLGRFYGARAFIHLARVEAGLDNTLDKIQLLEDGRKSHAQPKCVPYGKLAGAYCEAYCHYQIALGRDVEGQQTQHDLHRALSVLFEGERAVENLAPMVRAKIYGLAAGIARKITDGLEPNKAKEYQRVCAKALRDLRSRGHDFVDRVGLDTWLKTPIN